MRRKNFLLFAACSTLLGFSSNLSADVVDVNLAPGNSTISGTSIGNLGNGADPVSGATFGTDTSLFDDGNDLQIATGISTGGTVGAFTLDDGLGNSGSYQLSLAITGTTEGGAPGTFIEQGGTGAKGLVTASAGSSGGLTNGVDGAETLSITGLTLTPVAGTVVGNLFAFDGFTGVYLGLSDSVNDVGTINGIALDAAVGATTGNTGNNQNIDGLGFQSFDLSNDFVLTSTGSDPFTLTGLQFSATAAAVPEPSSLAILAIGAIGFVTRRRR